MVEHDPGQPARPQYAMQLADRARRVRRVMQHAIRIRHIKTLSCERKVLSVTQRKVAVLIVSFQVTPRNFERTRREIDAGYPRAATRKLQEVGAHAATHFEQTR